MSWNGTTRILSKLAFLAALLLPTGAAFAGPGKTGPRGGIGTPRTPAVDPAADSGASKDKKAAKDKAPVDAEDEFKVPPDEPVVRKVFSSAEVARICERYEGKMIAYYDDVYKVDHCKRRPILDNKTVYNLQRDGKKVEDVDGDVVAALQEGEPLDEAMSAKTARSCKQLEGQYVTYSNVDVYFVEHCRRRLFPDWTTYIKHREKRGDQKGEILSLSWIEFSQLKDGPPIPSIVDDLFAKLLTGEAGVDVIPVDEACEGVEGHIVSYYSRVYRIEKCRKREIVDPDLYLMRLGFDKVKILELHSDQWLSLPDGKPIEDKTANKQGTPTPFKRR